MNKNIEYGWVKYRTTHSSGSGDWTYQEVQLPFTQKSRKALREDIEYRDPYCSSIEVILIKHPPKRFLLDEAQSALKKIKLLQEKHERYSRLAESLPDKKYVFYTHSGLLAESKPKSSGWTRIYAEDIHEARKIVDEIRKTSKSKRN